MTWIAILGLLCVASASARADILEWRDEQGVRHFTNVAEDIPPEYRPGSKIVARERGGVVLPTSLGDGVEKEAAEPPRQAEVVYDQRRLAQVYQAGIEGGLRAAQRAREREAKPAPVIAPLAIASVPIMPSYGPYLPPSCERPFFGAGFDHGRLRHQTWRLGLERCQSPLTYGPAAGALDPRFLPLRNVSPRLGRHRR